MDGGYYGRTPINIDDMVKTIVMNVTGRSSSSMKSEPESKPATPRAQATSIASTSSVGAPAGASLPSAEEPSGTPTPLCKHTSKWHLFFRSCFVCPQLCNCAYSYFPDEYPDVLVRSVDKKIVRLSSYLVRASEILRSLVNEALRNEKKGDGKTAGTVVKAEHVVAIQTEYNDPYSIMDFQTLDEGDDADHFDLPPRESVRPAQAFYEAVRKANEDTVADLVDIDSKVSVLALFDPESDVPTFGISREVLKKLDNYICAHLDEVDQRVENRRKKEEYFEKSGLVQQAHVCYLDIAPDMLNTFAYEDWEEEFFNVDTVQFFDIYHANAELIIWDLYYAIEKWLYLGRGFPKAMVNGQYDFLKDPDVDEADINDKRNKFGLFNMYYGNPRRTRRHYRPQAKSPFFHPGMPARWWSIKTTRSAALTAVDNEEEFKRN